MKFTHWARMKRWCSRWMSPIFFEYDTQTLRMLMAAASLVFAGALLSSPVPFTKEAYSIMEWVGGQWLWAGLFILYGVVTMFLVTHERHNENWNLAFNIYGFFLWGFYTISVNLAVGYFAPTTALSTVTVILMAWSVYRTSRGRRIR